jgi:fructuronate reductase
MDLRYRTRPIRIVHIGIGNFHRAHQAWYTDRADTNREWGIAAFTGRHPDVARELGPQGGLYTLIERGPHSDRASILSSIVEVQDGANVTRFVEVMSEPGTAIVTLTVTEAGYRVNADGELNRDDQELRSDVVRIAASFAAVEPDNHNWPTTVIGRLVLGLAARKRKGSGPLSIVSCDNIPSNGTVLRRAVTTFASWVDKDLERWIESDVDFVCTVVDRITPATKIADREIAGKLIGACDVSPVVTEQFSEWILSGEFRGGRPQWEAAGARFVTDIEPYERRKLWLLNGAHTILANFGLQRGLTTIAEAVGDPEGFRRIEEFWNTACRHLPAALDLGEYRAALLERFRNPRIEHLLSQIARDSTTKLRYRVAPIARAELRDGRVDRACAFAFATWARLMIDGYRTPDPVDPNLEIAIESGNPSDALLRLVDRELASSQEFASAVRRAL